jgi:hypothetical protein
VGGDRRCGVDHPAAAPTELTPLIGCETPSNMGVYLPNRVLRVWIFRGSVYG